MKKLMIAAAAAAMVSGAFAGLCDDDPIEQAGCALYNLKFSMTTLLPKAVACKGGCEEADPIAYLEKGKRTFDGVLWMCESACTDLRDGGAQFVLWEKKFGLCLSDPLTRVSSVEDIADFTYTYTNGLAEATNIVVRHVGLGTYGVSMLMNTNLVAKLDAYKPSAPAEFSYLSGAVSKYIKGSATPVWVGTDAEFELINRFGKKATSVQAFWALDTEIGEFVAAGIGSYDKKIGMPKSVSGQAVGLIAVDDTFAVSPTKCADPVMPLIVDLCDDFIGYCDGDGEDADAVVAYGSWSMKYNKSLSNGKKRLTQIVPVYAQGYAY